MTLYSKPLGHGELSAPGTILLYTVPSSGGPAIARSIFLYAEAGAAGRLYFELAGDFIRVAVLDNSSGTKDETALWTPYQPLEPGDSIYLENDVAGLVQATVGGYQFSTP